MPTQDNKFQGFKDRASGAVTIGITYANLCKSVRPGERLCPHSSASCDYLHARAVLPPARPSRAPEGRLSRAAVGGALLAPRSRRCEVCGGGVPRAH